LIKTFKIYIITLINYVLYCYIKKKLNVKNLLEYKKSRSIELHKVIHLGCSIFSQRPNIVQPYSSILQIFIKVSALFKDLSSKRIYAFAVSGDRFIKRKYAFAVSGDRFLKTHICVCRSQRVKKKHNLNSW
jgi:hypothetical protein